MIDTLVNRLGLDRLDLDWRGIGLPTRESLSSLSFATPELLWALLAVPAIALVYLLVQRRRGRYAVRFTNVDLLANLVERRPGWRRHFPPLLYLGTLALLLASLARPQTVMQAPREEATVVLVMDTSGSMNAEDVTPTRLGAAKSAATMFLDQLPETIRVGLVSFDDTARTVLPPTTDRAVVRTALDQLGAFGGTAMGDALMQALLSADITGDSPGSSLPADEAGEGTRSRDELPLVVLLLSDGKNTAGATDPAQAAEAAARQGVPVFTIALGTAEGTIAGSDRDGRMLVPPDPETLRQIADVTGAESFSAPTEQDLQRIYESLGAQIGYVDEEREITIAFVGTALVLFLLGGGFALHWFNRFP